jgi:polar amino acid transport system substrate-binding protein
MRVAAVLLLTLIAAAPASARTLEQVKASGALSACLPANAMPFARRQGDPQGFQVEVAHALAKQLGVGLEEQWVISPIQALRANCDLRLDAIADAEAQGASHLVLTKPYYRSGVALVSKSDHPLASLADLNEHTKVAVMVGSITSMTLGLRHVGMTTFAFEDEMLQAVADGEADAAMVTPASAGYYNMAHPQAKLNVVMPKDAADGMAWNIAVGLRKPDPSLRQAVDSAIEKMVADGTMATIYGRYGITLPPPQ